MEAIDEALTLRPVGPPRHMGVEVVRHSTQLLLLSSTTPIPSTCKDSKLERIKLIPQRIDEDQPADRTRGNNSSGREGEPMNRG